MTSSLLEWESMAEREQKWTVFSTGPEWLEKRKQSEANGPLINSFSNAFLLPTEFSKKGNAAQDLAKDVSE
jgi:hypothetical protein